MQIPLSHVLWIGSPPDCGKTTDVTILAKRHETSDPDRATHNPRVIAVDGSEGVEAIATMVVEHYGLA